MYSFFSAPSATLSSALAASIAVIIVKDPTESKMNYVSIAAGTVCGILFVFTIVSMYQMYRRLHTPTPQTSKLMLRTGKGRHFAEVPEFYVGSEAPPPQGFRKRAPGSGAAAGTAGGYRPDESSSLLPCLERDGKPIRGTLGSATNV